MLKYFNTVFARGHRGVSLDAEVGRLDTRPKCLLALKNAGLVPEPGINKALQGLGTTIK